MLIFFIACINDSEKGAENDTPRSFLMGFTPWPHNATEEAVNWTYEKTNENGDIISHHIEQGVPWPEAYNGISFSAEFQTEIDSRILRYRAGKKVLLSVSPLNMERNGLAFYRGSSESMVLPSPWDSYALNSSEVKSAFFNYVERMVLSFQPDYLIIGVEVNLLIRNNPSLWKPYVELHDDVYIRLKKKYPDLSVGVSVFCVPFFPEWSPGDDIVSQLSGLTDLENTSDFIAFSVHPFMSSLTAESFPEDYLKTLFAMTDKPVAVSESSYPAQNWKTITEPIIEFNGTPEKQNAFLSSLLVESNNADALFVIWFSIHDYDALWEGLLNKNPLALVWRDTGLFDESGNGRISLALWQSWYKKK
ncbi:MAG: hypothetical protein A2015_12735 [Spirochaetes bacterium GWF1_31_7]|nr:MAG: hypothetical protein A2Y30_10525 [Spirochaetes bacterium GWE1_32_154]OHD51810.1 MAG: hypothetical protein A2015_12735 [Spirochaetes bacterium GWF1_31_7]HBI39158.1 hypothetical protein [Spirochaetia bacterium]